jgi:hypothetical protein
MAILRRLQHDNGSEFIANIVKELLSVLLARPIQGSPYHPQSQGAGIISIGFASIFSVTVIIAFCFCFIFSTQLNRATRP